MSDKKKLVRLRFRDSVFVRDKYTCQGCGYKSSIVRANEDLDAHHIINREKILNQGYVKENGISLCKFGNNCHLKAENIEIGFTEEDLFKKIKSSKEKAFEASKRL